MRRLVPGAMFAWAATAVLILSFMEPAGASISLPGSLNQTPESWTPNIFAGTTTTSVCDQWFGSGGCGDATVWSTAVVNGEVIVAGAFTEACQPGPGSSGHCAAGTEVTRDDLFAYQLGTGIIDTGFAPQLNQGPAYSVVAGPDNTVYVGGVFTTVNGATHKGVVQLNVTPGTASDGTVVSTFNADVSGFVRAMAFDGSNGLYIGGQFTTVDSTSEEGDARLNATSGAVDTSYSMPISDTPASGQALKVEAMSLTSNGKVLAISGPFLDVDGQSRPRVALINTGGGYGSTATLASWAAPILNNECSSEHDYVRAIDFSPNGNDVIIADTGYKASPVNSAGVCDAVAEFSAAQAGTNVAPLWINYTGGDSFYSVQDTGSVIYVGGHNRWTNNECGNNNLCESNAVLNMGFSAIDANTGLTLPWIQPLTLRGNGTMSLTTLPAGTSSVAGGGILIGNDVTQNAGSYHSFNALFPIASTATSPRFGSIPSGLFSQGRIGGYDEGGTTGNGVAAMCVTDAGDSRTAGTAVEFSTCTNAPAQNWTVESNGNVEVNGLCLDTMHEATTSGTQVDVNTCGSSATQVWKQGTGNTLVNSASGLCLTDPSSSTSNNPILQITACPTGTAPANQVWPLPAAPEPSSLIPDGPVSSLETATSGPSGQPNCLTETGGSTKPGALVQASTCTGGITADVTVQPAATAGTFNLVINGLCLDTVGEGTASGTGIFLNTCGSQPTQVWTQAANGQTLANRGAPGMCLNDPATTSGTDVTIATCSASTQAQQWWLPTM